MLHAARVTSQKYVFKMYWQKRKWNSILDHKLLQTRLQRQGRS